MALLGALARLMAAMLSDAQRKAANWLLHHSKGRPEDQIRNRIGALLDSLEIPYEVSYRTPGAKGACDIYLPRRRTIIETKAVGLADDPEADQGRSSGESPKAQLERYIHAEIAYELGSLDLGELSGRDWMGIVTDGCVWHVWRYTHETHPVTREVERDLRPVSPENLIEILNGFLSGELIGKPWIPADIRALFKPKLDTLHQVYANLPRSTVAPTETKRKLWLEMLHTSSMAPEKDDAIYRLFVSHSFLVALARGIIHVLGASTTPDPASVLGNGFVAWIVDSQKGRQWAKQLFEEIFRYEWRRRPGDVLRPLYEHIVGKSDRKAFGEFYTPDWLAELLVREVCDDSWCKQAITKASGALRKGADLKGFGVLDPTCGSGTFLYHAAQRLLTHEAMANRSTPDKAAIVCALVHGIDVHPVAAEIARATLLRALPAHPPNETSSIRIYEGDALLIRTDDETSLLRAEGDGIRILTPKGNEVSLPESLVERPSFVDDLRRMVLSVVEEKLLPTDIVEGTSKLERAAIESCHDQLVKIIAEEGNSVWTWYIRNITGPYLLSQKKVDRIVANPPWVKMAAVQAKPRKYSLEKFAKRKDIDLWSGGRQAPHFDIAQLFVKRCRQLYLANEKKNKAAWLVKKAALKSGNWRKFRLWHTSVLGQTLDLEKVQPFGGGDARRACVLFEKASIDNFRGKHLVVECIGKKPLSNESLETVWKAFKVNSAPRDVKQGVSGFVVGDKEKPLFRQGATIVPKVLSIVNRVRAGELADHVYVETLRSSHEPWSDIETQCGEVPERWLRQLFASNSMVPFSVLGSGRVDALIPIDESEQFSASEACNSAFWNQLDKIYVELCGTGGNTPKDLLSRLDYGSGLSRQLIVDDDELSMVVYPTSGDVMRSCRMRPGDGIIDSSLYWLIATDSSEAAYLVALLNAPALKEAFAQSRESGRHFHLHPWLRLPIQRYDKVNPDHVALAKLTNRAEELVKEWFADPDNASLNLGQIGYSKRIRTMLTEEGIFPEIDEVVYRLLPDQAR